MRIALLLVLFCFLASLVFRRRTGWWFSRTGCASALTGSEVRELIKWADKCGYVYEGPYDLQMIQDGHPIKKILLFCRASDMSMACVDPHVPTLEDAEIQFIGAKLLWHYLQDVTPRKVSPNRNDEKPL
jgi:hypothetical protein